MFSKMEGHSAAFGAGEKFVNAFVVAVNFDWVRHCWQQPTRLQKRQKRM